MVQVRLPLITGALSEVANPAPLDARWSCTRHDDDDRQRGGSVGLGGGAAAAAGPAVSELLDLGAQFLEAVFLGSALVGEPDLRMGPFVL